MGGLIGITKRNHFIWLTVAMLGTMMTRALGDEFPGYVALTAIEYFNTALLLMALLSLRKDRSWITGLLIILISMVVIIVGQQTTTVDYLDTAYLLLLLSFYLLVIWLVGRQVLFTGKVDFNQLMGSVALYLMLGLFFSVLYTLLLQFSPHALNGIEVMSPNENLAEMSYFSFVTLTTLGFGDISPATPIARVIVVIEAVTGMFFLAMIVASQVGAMRDQKTQPPERD